MTSATNAVNYVMDEIRDAEMLLGYADAAAESGDREMHDWFCRKAQERMRAVESDWSAVGDKVRNADPESVRAILLDVMHEEIERTKARVHG